MMFFWEDFEEFWVDLYNRTTWLFDGFWQFHVLLNSFFFGQTSTGLAVTLSFITLFTCKIHRFYQKH